MSAQLTLFSESSAEPSVMAQDYCGISGLRYLSNVVNRTRQQWLLNEVDRHPWLNDLKRRVQHYGYRYDYKARRIDTSMYVGPLPVFASELARELRSAGIISHNPDQLIVNEYLPGQGITSHVDCEPCFADEIATVSLGSVYEMELAEIATGRVEKVDLELGSCMVFSGSARYQWKHGIKPRASDGKRRRERRVSLTFRRVILENAPS